MLMKKKRKKEEDYSLAATDFLRLKRQMASVFLFDPHFYLVFYFKFRFP